MVTRADLQAEVRRLRRFIAQLECDTDAAGGHSDTCGRCIHLAGSVVADQSALVEMLTDAARNGVYEGAAYATKLHGVTADNAVSAYATNVFNVFDVSEIVERVLSGGDE